MSGRVQGPPRGEVPSLPRVLWTLLAIVACLVSGYVSAHVLVFVATWLLGGA